MVVQMIIPDASVLIHYVHLHTGRLSTTGNKYYTIYNKYKVYGQALHSTLAQSAAGNHAYRRNNLPIQKSHTESQKLLEELIIIHFVRYQVKNN